MSLVHPLQPLAISPAAHRVLHARPAVRLQQELPAARQAQAAAR